MTSLRPRFWPYLSVLLLLAPLWVVIVEGGIHPSEIRMASASSSHRLLWWLLPPMLLVLAVFAGRWLYLAAQATAAGERQAAGLAESTRQQSDEQAKATATLARQQETLEVLGLGLTVEKFRNAQVWEAIEKMQDRPFESILPKAAEQVSGPLVRGQWTGKRSDDTAEYATHYFVEKVPLPGFVVFPKPTTKDPKYLESGAGTLMGQRDAFTLFITAEQIYADDPDELLSQIFDFFNAHPDVPGVYVYADDGYITRKFFRGYSPADINGDPGWKPGDPTEAMTAFILVRRDRVDQLIRPYAVEEPFKVDYEDKSSFVNRVWHFFFDLAESHKPSMIPTVPEWLAAVPKLIEEGQHVPVSGLLPFWGRGTDGFKPSPWIPVPWAKWQLDEFDALPTLGYLHRPQYANYRDADGKALPAKGRAAAFAGAWRSALGTLAEGERPARLLFDAGSVKQRAHGLLPMTQAFAAEPNAPWRDWLDTPQGIDTSARLGDTGAASPFVQIALALIAGYRAGGVTATVNLRRPDGAGILMVSPPTEPLAQRKPHPGGGQDPFKVKLAPEF